MNPNLVVAALAALPVLLLPVILNAETRDVSPRDPLTLEAAVELALDAEEPTLRRLEARAEAIEHQAVADAQLPDPSVTSRLANVPTDTFAFDQADMTQFQVGLRQEFPPGRTLALRGRRLEEQANAERARLLLEARQIALETREAWLELAYRTRAMAIIADSRRSVAQQIDSLAARFATGGLNAQAVLRAELELSLLDDSLTEHQREAELARATLARYVGEYASAPLPQGWPDLEEPPALARLVADLAEHPAVAAESAEIEAAAVGIELAEQAYKPALALEGSYGIRDDRPDFATLGVTLSLPLFTDKRQDRRRLAAVRQRGAELLDRDATLLDLKRRLDQAWADWRYFRQRVDLYQTAVAERAKETADASVTTYANGQTDFAELIRSQLAELEIALKLAELKARGGQAWARLMYLAGESS